MLWKEEKEKGGPNIEGCPGREKGSASFGIYKVLLTDEAKAVMKGKWVLVSSTTTCEFPITSSS